MCDATVFVNWHFPMFEIHEFIWYYDLLINIQFLQLIFLIDVILEPFCVCSVFSVDYNDELDLLVSGSADFSVKVWALSAGACLNTLTGHTEWVTKVS